jgi:flagellar hook-length control protein FliK
MNSALAPVSAVPPAAAPTAGAGSSTADGVAPGAFSQQLAQHRAAEQAADHTAQAASTAARRAAAARSAASGAAANSASAGRGAASAATEAQAVQAEASARAPAAATIAATSSDPPPAADDDTSGTDTVNELLAQLQGSDSLPALSQTSTAAAARAAMLADAASPEFARPAAADSTDSRALVDAATEATHEAGAPGAQAPLLQGQGGGNETPRGQMPSDSAWTAATEDAAQGTAALQAQATATTAEAPVWSPVATGVPGAASAQPTPGMPVAAAPAPLPEARLPAPPGHADFAPQLGAQISVFIREGLQQARLQLNPAEMGPISVQIRLDGGNAQVHLAAEHAATRQALEQALPTLASSLRESGLTLTGGGVFEQPRQSGSDSQDPGRPAARADTGSGRPGDGADSGPALPPAPMGAPRRGVVDLVA